MAWDVITYFKKTSNVSLLFKKRAMPTSLYNEHHITFWHCMVETNIIKNQTPMCCYNSWCNNYKKEKHVWYESKYKMNNNNPMSDSTKKYGVWNISGQHRELRYMDIVSSSSKMVMILSLFRTIKFFFESVALRNCCSWLGHRCA